jgi:hydrogenase maturation protease
VSEQARPLVVVGVGNVLLTDDAIGIRVVDGLRRLQADDPAALPVGTRLVDGGTLLVDLLHTVRDARGLVLVDAVRLGEPVGAVSVLHADAILSAGASTGREADATAELLALARLLGWLPEAVTLVGIEVADTRFGADLTPLVAAALPLAMDAVRAELRAMDEQIAACRNSAAAPSETTGALA